jgi:hypothetical protein
MFVAGSQRNSADVKAMLVVSGIGTERTKIPTGMACSINALNALI